MQFKNNSLRVLLPLLTTGAILGCTEKKAADEPIILGTPPAVAYLGVEYYYNFGTDGGENLFNYALSNAPGWAALESSVNTARPGVVLRGVPGITGGRRGALDLGKNERVSLTVNDGGMFASAEFDIEVKHNALRVAAATLKEGEAYIPDVPGMPEEGTPDAEWPAAICKLPDMKLTGTWVDQNVPVYGADDMRTGFESREFKTHPVLVEVVLDKPSVEPVSVAFELFSDFSPDTCDTGFDAGHRLCESSRTNLGRAQVGIPSNDNNQYIGGESNRDVLANSGTLPVPSYLQYTGTNKGVLTFQPGVTNCFIRLEVVDDDFAERSETAAVRLTEVLSGLATLDRDGANRRAAIQIQDNEPSATVSSAQSMINEGRSRTFTVKLEGAKDRTDPVRVGITRSNANGGTALADDYRLSAAAEFVAPESPADQKSLVLVFPVGTDEIDIRVDALRNTNLSNDPTENDPFRQDDLLLLVGDVSSQFGRKDYARTDNLSLQILINEWLGERIAGSDADGFTPTSIASGDTGGLFVVGHRGGIVELHVYNRFGAIDQTFSWEPEGGLPGVPQVAYSQREININADVVLRREIAVGFETAAQIEGASGTNIELVVLRREATEPAYQSMWRAVVGSSGNDALSGVRMDAANNVYIGGTTDGTWAGSTTGNRGGRDVFMARVDNTNEGAALAWAQMAGSTLDDQAAALGVSSTGYTTVVGSTPGQMGSVVEGGLDVFHATTRLEGSFNFVVQAGTAQDDLVRGGDLAGESIWLFGDGLGDFTVDSSFRIAPEKVRDSRDGFLVAYDLNQGIRFSQMVSDKTGEGEERLFAFVGNTREAVIAGDTTGAFESEDVPAAGRDAILARYAADGNALKEEWRRQWSSLADERIVQLASFYNGKLFALVEVVEGAARRFDIRVVSPQGDLLSEANALEDVE